MIPMNPATESRFRWRCVCGDVIESAVDSDRAEMMGNAVGQHIMIHAEEEHLSLHPDAASARYEIEFCWICPCQYTVNAGKPGVFVNLRAAITEHLQWHREISLLFRCDRCNVLLSWPRKGFAALRALMLGVQCDRCDNVHYRLPS